MSKKSYLSRLIILVLTFNVIVSTSYAYFVGTVDNMSGTSAADVTTSHLKINYSENNHLNLTGMLPGAVFIKNFNIENTGDDIAHYGLELNDVYNELDRKDDLVYTVNCSNGGAMLGETTYPDISQTIVNDVMITPNTTHICNLTIYYLNLDEDQSEDMGKTVTGTINVIPAIEAD